MRTEYFFNRSNSSADKTTFLLLTSFAFCIASKAEISSAICWWVRLPFLDFVAAEMKISGSDGVSPSYYGFVEVDGTLVFFEAGHSLYAAMLDNDDLESFKTGMYPDYCAFYAELDAEKPLSVRSRIRKPLICLVRATRKETEVLKREMPGKTIGALALPSSDMEQFYEEMKITGRWEL